MEKDGFDVKHEHLKETVRLRKKCNKTMKQLTAGVLSTTFHLQPKIFNQNQLKWLCFYFEPCIYCLIETFITMVPQNMSFSWISLPNSSLKRCDLEKGENKVQ